MTDTIAPTSPPVRYTGTHIPAVLATMERDFAWLSRKMGVSLTLVYRVCNGERSITQNFVDRACRALSLPAEVLFFSSEARHSRMDKDTERLPAEVA